MSNRTHWENVYQTKAVETVSWFQEHAERSLALIQSIGDSRSASIIDVGAGASTLVDDLLTDGYENISVLDLSSEALSLAGKRLGPKGRDVKWIVGDICSAELPERAYDIWHDRAVFHFLTDEADRRRYVAQVWNAVRPGGFVIVATFGPNGPLQCSNLDVCRYAPESLHGEFGAGYELMGHQTELHTTPAGQTQEFVYCYCRRTG